MANMSQRLIQPGLSAAGKYHPRTALPLEPIGEVNGIPIWPVIGGDETDDPDDPRFQDGGGEDDEDEDDDEDDDDTEDEDDESEDEDEDDDDKKKKSKKSKKKSKDDDESKPVYTEDEMHAVKRRMRKADQRAARFEEELKTLRAQITKGGGKKIKKTSDDDDTSGGVDNEEMERLRKRNADLENERRQVRLERAFSRSPLPEGEEWVDVEDAMAVAERLGLLEDVLEEDGTVDRRSLRAALRELRRRKPHLVRKVSDPDENEDEEDDDDRRSKRRTASKMNGKRKGSKKGSSKEELANRFPVLRR